MVSAKDDAKLYRYIVAVLKEEKRTREQILSSREDGGYSSAEEMADYKADVTVAKEALKYFGRLVIAASQDSR